MHLSTFTEWLDWITSVHSKAIELGLDRVKKVAMRLNVLSPRIPVIIVAGTNGKGSTVAGLEAIYRSKGYKVGCFTSPFLIKPNEQVRINGVNVKDEEFCEAFAKIAAARGDTPLTYFEFFTLAALVIFTHYPLDVLILEVGLGGRLDAVNILDADVAVVTSIGIDHVEFLGNTRDDIAREKAGIFRQGKPAVSGDLDPPLTLVSTASQLGTPLFCQGRDFYYSENTKKTWSWSYQNIQYKNLPINSLATQNMSTVLMAITLLQDRLPVSQEEIRQGLLAVNLPGRIQVINGDVVEIYDVSHNPDAVSFLAKKLSNMPCKGKTHAVFSMLGDKDILHSIEAIKNGIDDWYVSTLATQRTASMERLQDVFLQAGISSSTFYPTISKAYQTAKSNSIPGDRIVVFGSFHTVSEVMREFS